MRKHRRIISRFTLFYNSFYGILLFLKYIGSTYIYVLYTFQVQNKFNAIKMPDSSFQ